MTAIILHTISVWIKIAASLLFSLNWLEYQCTSCRTNRLYNLWIAGSGSQPSFSSGNDSFLNNSEYLSGSEVRALWPAKQKVYEAYNDAEVLYSQLYAFHATVNNSFHHITTLYWKSLGFFTCWTYMKCHPLYAHFSSHITQDDNTFFTQLYTNSSRLFTYMQSVDLWKSTEPSYHRCPVNNRFLYNKPL